MTKVSRQRDTLARIALAALLASGCGTDEPPGESADASGDPTTMGSDPTMSTSSVATASDGTAGVVDELCTTGGEKTWCFERSATSERLPRSMPDFDGDGLADMFGWNTDHYYLALNDGQGAFATEADEWSYPFPDSRWPAVLDGNAATGWVLLSAPLGGKYEGRFEVRALSTAGGADIVFDSELQLGGADFVRVADFDADGSSDALVAMVNATTVEVFRGTPSGDYEPGLLVELAHELGEPLEISDLDVDGVVDLVSYDWMGMTAFFGGGDLDFPEFDTSTSVSFTRSVVIADLESDGRPDIVAGDNDGVDVLWAEGKTWGAAVEHSFDSPIDQIENAFVAAGELDGDGLPELIAYVDGASTDGAQRVHQLHILHGFAADGFAADAVLVLDDTCPENELQSAQVLAPGDLDGDGAGDLHVFYSFRCTPDADVEVRSFSLLQRVP